MTPRAASCVALAINRDEYNTVPKIHELSDQEVLVGLWCGECMKHTFKMNSLHVRVYMRCDRGGSQQPAVKSISSVAIGRQIEGQFLPTPCKTIRELFTEGGHVAAMWVILYNRVSATCILEHHIFSFCLAMVSVVVVLTVTLARVTFGHPQVVFVVFPDPRFVTDLPTTV
jgi:hypothetical protein